MQKMLALHGAICYNLRCALYLRVFGLRAAQHEVNDMKEGIHPNYQRTTIRCACGEVIETYRACPACGFYKGRQVLKITEEKTAE